MHYVLAPLILLLGLLGSSGDPCVPEGGTLDLEFDRPALGEPGDPAGAWWKEPHGDPQAWEVDPLPPNDPMGPGTPSADGTSATVEIENKAGKLSGPNGTVQNTGTEGNTIEVKMCWTYYYVDHIYITYDFKPFGVGGSVTIARDIVRSGRKCSEPQEVSPCK